MTTFTPEQTHALDVARALAAHGIPIFVAPEGWPEIRSAAVKSWQTSPANPAWIDAWQPGKGLCAVMGHGLDLVDLDPRNGGNVDSLNGAMPTAYAIAATPSGGLHAFVKSMGVRSHDAVAPGVDVKAGDAEGNGRGFAFIAPTVRKSKVTGELAAYTWTREPDLDALKAATDDRSGDRLAAMVRAARGSQRTTGEDEFDLAGQPSPWDDIPKTLSAQAGGRRLGVYKLACALRGRGGWRVGDALAYMRATVWPVIDQQQGGHPLTEAEFETAIRDAFTRHEDGRPEPPRAHVDRPELDITLAAEAADWLRDNLGTGLLAGMFSRTGEIVHTPREGEDGYVPLTDRDTDADGPAQVRSVTASTLSSRMAYTYWCYRWAGTKDDPVKVHSTFPIAAARVPVDVPDMLPNLRRLRGVVHTPILRADGTVLTEPGYDPGTGLLHLPEPGLDVPPVPDRPTGTDTAAAVVLLDEMVADFRFVTEHDKANYYGLLLTPLLRELVPPPYKLGGIGAPQPGSGKTLLATILRIIHGGVFRSEMPEDDAELRKQITAILDVTTGPVIHFDNVSGVLRSSTLAGLLTSDRWDDRRLGSTNLVSRRNDRLWVITGNNLSLGGDLVRRTLWVTIDPGVPDPHLRTDFAIPVLEDWVREHRGRLISALLTVIRAWVVKGKPITVRAGDGFAQWVAAVDGILTTAGIKGTFDSPESARQTVGTDDDDWADFLEAAHQVFGDRAWSVKELLAKVNTDSDQDGPVWLAKYPIPLDVLPADLAERVARSRTGAGIVARSLGMWLRNRDGRWAGRRTVRAAGLNQHDGVKLWRIGTLSAGTAGSAGTKTDPQEQLPEDDHGPVGASGTPGTSPRSPRSPRTADTPQGASCVDCGKSIPAYQVDKRAGRCITCHYQHEAQT